MDKVQITRERFRLDRWWGVVIFMALHYLLYWWIFYGIWFLIPYSEFNYFVTHFAKLAPYYIFGLVPLISFYIPYKLGKLIKLNKIILYILHIIIDGLAIFLFFLYAIETIYKHFNPLTGL